MANVFKNLFKSTDSKPKPPERVAVLELKVNCDKCCRNIEKTIKKYKGVKGVELDLEREVAKVRGTFNPEELKKKILQKRKKRVEIVSQEIIGEGHSGDGHGHGHGEPDHDDGHGHGEPDHDDGHGHGHGHGEPDHDDDDDDHDDH